MLFIPTWFLYFLQVLPYMTLIFTGKNLPLVSFLFSVLRAQNFLTFPTKWQGILCTHAQSEGAHILPTKFTLHEKLGRYFLIVLSIQSFPTPISVHIQH